MNAWPTTEEVLATFEASDRLAFNRWLRDHDAKVRAEVLREAADDLDSNFQDLPGWDRAYRIGVRTREWEHGAITIVGDVIRKLRDRADRIERGDFL